MVGRNSGWTTKKTLCVFRCIEVVQVVHNMCLPWDWVLPEIQMFVFHLPEMHVVVQSPGVLESLWMLVMSSLELSMDSAGLSSLVTFGVYESAVVSGNESPLRTWLLEATAVDMDTPFRGLNANPKMRRIVDEVTPAARAVASLLGNLVIGGQVRKIIDCFLSEFPHVVDDCNCAIGSEEKDAGPKVQGVEAFRVRLDRYLGTEDRALILETALHRSDPGYCLRGPHWRKLLLFGVVMVRRQAFFLSPCLPVFSLWRS